MAKQADKKPSFFAGTMSFLSWCAVLLLWASAAGIYLHPARFFASCSVCCSRRARRG